MVNYSFQEKEEKLTGGGGGGDGVGERVGDIGIADESVWIAPMISIWKAMLPVVVMLFLSFLPCEMSKSR